MEYSQRTELRGIERIELCIHVSWLGIKSEEGVRIYMIFSFQVVIIEMMKQSPEISKASQRWFQCQWWYILARSSWFLGFREQNQVRWHHLLFKERKSKPEIWWRWKNTKFLMSPATHNPICCLCLQQHCRFKLTRHLMLLERKLLYDGHLKIG